MSVLSGTKTGNEKYPALTGVRAVGATVVFFDHFPLLADSHVIVNVLAFFFALSGFLIVRIYYEQVELQYRWLSKYFVNRFARIYPVYFLLLSIAVCLQHDLRPWTLLQNYTLTHGLFHNADLIIQPSWSLTTEECFYFLAPLFMVLARTYNLLAPLTLGCLLLCAALLISRFGIDFLGTPGFVLSTTFFGHFLEFFAGAYLALALLKLEKRGSVALPGSRYTLIGVAAVSLLSVAMIMVYRQVPLPTLSIILINNFLIPFPIALLYWGLLRENTALSRLLSSRAFGLLGRASYSFYLLHTLIINYVSVPLLLSGIGYRPLCVLLTFLFTWLVSIALFIFYEEPVNVFIRRKFRSKEQWVGVQATLFK
jgi:peptidoglycan/LPS O-acetylase OafA/YrhL